MHQSTADRETGGTDKSFGDIISEVKIIKQQLRHPNVVRYRRVFVENDKLYIVMDLIDGASLKEHINSAKEKATNFPEDRIWNIVIQVVLLILCSIYNFQSQPASSIKLSVIRLQNRTCVVYFSWFWRYGTFTKISALYTET